MSRSQVVAQCDLICAATLDMAGCAAPSEAVCSAGGADGGADAGSAKLSRLHAMATAISLPLLKSSSKHGSPLVVGKRLDTVVDVRKYQVTLDDPESNFAVLSAFLDLMPADTLSKNDNAAVFSIVDHECSGRLCHRIEDNCVILGKLLKRMVAKVRSVAHRSEGTYSELVSLLKHKVQIRRKPRTPEKASKRVSQSRARGFVRGVKRGRDDMTGASGSAGDLPAICSGARASKEVDELASLPSLSLSSSDSDAEDASLASLGSVVRLDGSDDAPDSSSDEADGVVANMLLLAHARKPLLPMPFGDGFEGATEAHVTQEIDTLKQLELAAGPVRRKAAAARIELKAHKAAAKAAAKAEKVAKAVTRGGQHSGLFFGILPVPTVSAALATSATSCVPSLSACSAPSAVAVDSSVPAAALPGSAARDLCPTPAVVPKPRWFVGSPTAADRPGPPASPSVGGVSSVAGTCVSGVVDLSDECDASAAAPPSSPTAAVAVPAGGTGSSPRELERELRLRNRAPPGFKVQARMRTGGKSADTVDYYLISPEGKSFRSLHDVFLILCSQMMSVLQVNIHV